MWKKFLLIGIGVGLFLVILTHIDREKTWTILRGADWKLCLAALAAFLIMIYLKGVRWSYLLKMQGYRYPVWQSFLVYLVSMYWGNITPGRAGDFIKVLYLKEDLKMPAGVAMASVLVDRVFDLYILLILGCLGILIYPMPADPRLIQLVWIFFGFLLLATFMAFNKRIGEVLVKAIFQRMMGKNLKEKTGQAFEHFHEGMEAFYKPALAVPVILSFAAYWIAFLACSWLAQSVGLNISLFYLAFCISIVNIVSLLTFLGMGTRDGALILLFGLIGIGKEQAMAYSLLLLFVGTALFTTICFIATILKPIQIQNKS